MRRLPGARRALLELLEDRLALSATASDTDTVLAAPALTTTANSPVTTNLATVVNSGSASPVGVGFSPSQIRTAYGLNALPLAAGGAALDGTGQTVAIVDAYNDPNIVSDLDGFDQQFGITSAGQTLYAQYGAASSFLTVLNEGGKTSPLPANDPGGPSSSSWELEESLDVEWVHAIAPGAKIVLVESSSTGWSDLATSVLTAAQASGVSVVSMSWGTNESGSITVGQAKALDATMAALPGISWVAATGDSGGQSLFPATSPNVLGVGATSLKLNTDNSYQSETAWADSSGGYSVIEAKPTYQDAVLPSNATQRSAPDVSFDGNPNTGVAVYDSYDNGAATPWSEEGGTSLGTPVWAGLVALADQGRVAAGQSKLNSASSTELLSAIYSLPQDDFHDVTSGSDKNNVATVGYDQVTGLGTPVANLLVPDLINYGAAVTLSPGSIASGTVGTAYSQSITAAGGVGGKVLTYSILSGALPAGLSISTSTSELDVTGDPLAAGSVTFKVTATDSQSDTTSQTYTLNVTSTVPTITGVAPAAGPLAGGTTVTISGTNLAGATAVDFGGTPATIVNDSANQLVVTSPQGSVGTVNITVIGPGGTSAVTAADQFTFVATPTVTGVSPSSEQTPSGLITISGTNLSGATLVEFGNTSAAIESDTANQIVVQAPNVSGTVDVTVTTAGGTSAITPADQFSILLASPTVAFSQTPPANTNQTSATFAFTGTGDASTPANQLTYVVSLDGSAFTPATNPVTFSNLASGGHTLEVEAVDLDSVASAPATYNWQVNTTAPTSQVTALPYATSQTSFTVSWSGSDGQGAGIASYTVYVSADGGSFVPWMTGTTQTSATFNAQLGHTYAFNSTAVDFSGNAEAPHGTADATIIVTATPWRNPANPLDVNASGAVTAIDALVIINYLNAQNVTTLPATNPGGAPFLDVNGDNSITALDALWVINYLNSQSAVASGIASGSAIASGVAADSAIADSASTGPTALGPGPTNSGAASDQQPAAAFTAETSAVAVAASPLTDSLPTGTNPLTDPAAGAAPAGGGAAPPAPAVSASVAPAAALSGMIGSGINALASDPTDDQPVSVFAANEQLAAATSSTGPSVPLGLAASGRLFSPAMPSGGDSVPGRTLLPAAVDAAFSAWSGGDS